VYLVIDMIENAENFAWRACRIAEGLGEAADMPKSCVLAYSIDTVRTGESNTEGLKKLYGVVAEAYR